MSAPHVVRDASLHRAGLDGDLLTCSCGWSAPAGESEEGRAMLAHREEVRAGREAAEARLRESVDDPDGRVEL